MPRHGPSKKTKKRTFKNHSSFKRTTKQILGKSVDTINNSNRIRLDENSWELRDRSSMSQRELEILREFNRPGMGIIGYCD